MTRVLILGARGMLGSMIAGVLGQESEVVVIASSRHQPILFDARRDDIGRMLDATRPTWVINAVGVLRARIDEQDSTSIEDAIKVNALFPHLLAHAAHERGARIISAATDGVFSGRDGNYHEDAIHDASDAYGRTKSLGEAPGSHVVNLRCSIVGPEPHSSRSLLSRVLTAAHGDRIPGFEDHRWNGITTLHFARICRGIIRSGRPLSGVVHVLPSDVVTKAELLRLLAGAHGRHDLLIDDGPSPEPADRSLATLDLERNRMLWRAAGHDAPPTVRTMTHELARARR